MLPVLASAAGDTVAWLPFLGSTLVAALTVGGAIYTARSTLRASSNANAVEHRRLDVERDNAREEREAAELRQAWELLDQCRAKGEKLAGDLAEWRERFYRLRLGVIAAGHDPDTMILPRQRSTTDDPPADRP